MPPPKPPKIKQEESSDDDSLSDDGSLPRIHPLPDDPGDPVPEGSDLGSDNGLEGLGLEEHDLMKGQLESLVHRDCSHAPGVASIGPKICTVEPRV